MIRIVHFAKQYQEMQNAFDLYGLFEKLGLLLFIYAF